MNKGDGGRFVVRWVKTTPVPFMVLCGLFLVGSVGVARAADAPLSLKHGDHVIVVGNTLAERMQYFGHWETLLHLRFPQHELYVRNLGWSADEVALRPRSQNFAEHGHTLADHRADVVIAMFGFNESFAGPAGLRRFRTDLEKFLHETTTTKFNGSNPPHVVLCSPIAHENLHSRYYPDGAKNNENLTLYTDAMRAIAAAVPNVRFVDLFEPSRKWMATATEPLTINGVHLNERGDAAVATLLDRALFGNPPPPNAGDLPQRVRNAVNEKNRQFFFDLRAVNGFYIYGGRRNPFGTVSFPPEFEKLRRMIALRDRRIWDLAQGKTVPDSLDDRSTGELPTVPSNFKAPIKITTPSESRDLMQLADGFDVNLFASEVDFPDLQNPVQFAFDARGRLWVCTMPSYPHYVPGQPPNDKILILEDTDGDGRADKQTVFADGLYLPTGLELGDGGVYVAQQPNLMFLRDTDGDDRADRRELILHGFDSADSHHAISAFTWDQGGALYFEEGTFLYSQIETPHGPVRCANAGVYRFEPRTGRLGVFVSYRFANPWGHVFDRWGQNFVADASPGFNYFGTAFSGEVDYPTKHATMRQFFEKQWRPTAGCELVSSRNFPDEMQGDYLLNNCIGFQGVLRYRMKEKDSGFVAEPAEPLLASRDLNFRPVDIEFGPDGALYLCDWFNPLVGHMQHSIRDPNRDHSHGRIWRVTYTKKPLVAPMPIAARPVRELLDVLRTVPEERTCYRVRTELRGRDTDEVMSAVDAWLKSLDANDPQLEHHRLEALWLRQQHDIIDSALLKSLLQSTEPRARAAAVRVLCYWRDRVDQPLDLLQTAITDPHPRVRLEAIRSLSFFQGERPLAIAAELVRYPLDDYLRYTLQETWATLDGRARRAETKLDPAAPSPTVAPLVTLLKRGAVSREQIAATIELICQHGHAPDLTYVFERHLVANEHPVEVRVQVVEALVDAATNRKLRPGGDLQRLGQLIDSEAVRAEPRLQRGLQRLASLWQLAAVTAELKKVLYKAQASDEAIGEAVRDLAALDDPNAQELLKELTTRDAPSMRVRLRALAAYARLAPRAAAPTAAATLSEAGPTDRIGDVLDAFLQRKEGAELLADALTKRPLHADTAKMALRHVYSVGRSDAALSRVLSDAAGVAADTAPPTAAQIQQVARDAAARGDARRGESVFRRADLSCQRCHALHRAGGNVGPELTSIGSISPVEYVAASILDPNLAIKEQYVTRVIITDQGETFTGILLDRNDTIVRLRDAKGEVVTIPVDDIDEEAEGRSLMPQGLTKFLTQDEMLDLIKFVSELGRPGDYAARSNVTVQRWRVWKTTAPDSVAGDSQGKQIKVPTAPADASTLYATFHGEAPLSELPAVVATYWVEGELNVTEPGSVGFAFTLPPDSKMWLDGQPLTIGNQSPVELTRELTRGRHRLSLQIARPERPTGSWKVELRKPAMSRAQFEPVVSSP